MRILLFADGTTKVDIGALTTALDPLLTRCSLVAGQSYFEIPSVTVHPVTSYALLSEEVKAECATADIALLVTRKRYVNNFFWDASDRRFIVSIADWELLTDVAVETGIAYFVVNAAFEALDVGVAHDVTTGCVSDVLWDKTGIDGGLRAAFLCRTCRAALAQRGRLDDTAVIEDLEGLLGHVAGAARRGRSITDVLAVGPGLADQEFDTFLCHNSADKPEVRRLAHQLRAEGLRPWLDEEQLRPGLPWQDALEATIGSVRSATVCIGPSGSGPWQDIERRAFIRELVERECPVIPVILPGAPSPPPLPLFLRDLIWVDLRDDPRGGLQRLAWGITGRP